MQEKIYLKLYPTLFEFYSIQEQIKKKSGKNYKKVRIAYSNSFISGKNHKELLTS